MSIKSPSKAVEHVSLLDEHHSVLLAVFTIEHPLCITRFEAEVLGGILSRALILDTLCTLCFSCTSSSLLTSGLTGTAEV